MTAIFKRKSRERFRHRDTGKTPYDLKVRDYVGTVISPGIPRLLVTPKARREVQTEALSKNLGGTNPNDNMI